MNTPFLLLAQYQTAVVPIDLVARDYFAHLDPAKLVKKIDAGEIRLPMVRMDPSSQKSAKGVHLQDLADWIDRQRQAAQNEVAKMGGR